MLFTEADRPQAPAELRAALRTIRPPIGAYVALTRALSAAMLTRM